MDTIDMALLELLEEDARRTPEQVGVLLGLTGAEAKARIEHTMHALEQGRSGMR